MTLYLVQHAEAAADSADPRKPLTSRGEKDARALAAACARKRMRVSGIVHSGKLRALQTAEILAEALGASVREAAGLDPLDPVMPFAASLATLPDLTVLVGHNPFLERLAALLLAGREDPPVLVFQRGGMACLAESGGSWRLLWTAFPDQPAPGGA